MSNPNEYPTGTLSKDKLNIIVFNSGSGQNEWQVLNPATPSAKKKTVKDDEIAAKP